MAQVLTGQPPISPVPEVVLQEVVVLRLDRLNSNWLMSLRVKGNRTPAEYVTIKKPPTKAVAELICPCQNPRSRCIQFGLNGTADSRCCFTVCSIKKILKLYYKRALGCQQHCSSSRNSRKEERPVPQPFDQATLRHRLFNNKHTHLSCVRDGPLSGLLALLGTGWHGINAAGSSNSTCGMRGPSP